MRFKRRRGQVTAELDAGEAALLSALAGDLLGLLGDGEPADDDVRDARRAQHVPERAHRARKRRVAQRRAER